MSNVTDRARAYMGRDYEAPPEYESIVADFVGFAKRETLTLTEEVRDLRAVNKALDETVRELREGKPAPHFCAYCLTNVPPDEMIAHMADCVKHSASILSGQLVEVQRLAEYWRGRWGVEVDEWKDARLQYEHPLPWEGNVTSKAETE